jgi:hypothetical protein
MRRRICTRHARQPGPCAHLRSSGPFVAGRPASIVRPRMGPPRAKRSPPPRVTRLAVFLAGLGLVVAAGALGGCGSAASDSRPALRLAVDGGLVQAHTLPNDRLLAGPVLVDHRAVWVEAGRRLFVRSLDASGRTRTIFSTSKTPGAPKGIVWPFWVANIAVGGGRVAFEDGVIPCASAPRDLPGCAPSTMGPAVTAGALSLCPSRRPTGKKLKSRLGSSVAACSSRMEGSAATLRVIAPRRSASAALAGNLYMASLKASSAIALTCLSISGRDTYALCRTCRTNGELSLGQMGS